MNFLAHAYLSFSQPDILTGNMISDFVKGKKKFDYSSGIQKGIALHRAIDQFTDSHYTTKEAKEIFRPAYRLYAGSLIDVIYDHFLANDTNEFSDNSLKGFASETYQILDVFTDSFPEKFRMMYPYMKSQNWLYNYRHLRGIERSLGGVVRRSKYMTESKTAYRLLIENYDKLGQYYRQFFPELKKMSIAFLQDQGN